MNKIVFAGFRTVVWLIFQDDDTSNFADDLVDCCLGIRGKTKRYSVFSVSLLGPRVKLFM